jgi:hypothetical protein
MLLCAAGCWLKDVLPQITSFTMDDAPLPEFAIGSRRRVKDGVNRRLQGRVGTVVGLAIPAAGCASYLTDSTHPRLCTEAT